MMALVVVARKRAWAVVNCKRALVGLVCCMKAWGVVNCKKA